MHEIRVFPVAEGTGEPYGINRQVVEGAARAGAALGSSDTSPTQEQRGLDFRPVPALNQVVDENPPTGEVDKAGNSSSSSTSSKDAGDIQDDSMMGKGPPGKVVGAGASGSNDALPLPASIPECNDGKGQIRFERILDTIREPSNKPYDAVRIKGIPAEVLGKCENLCLKDVTAEQDLKAICESFDFVPGRRISSYSYNVDYTETKCFTYRPPEQFETPRYINQNGSYHMREVCYTASVVKQECPTEKYVIERMREMKFLPNDAKQVPAKSLEECQDKCLGQYAEGPINNTRLCRSGTWDQRSRRCYHSSYTRRTHQRQLEPDPNYDYFENTCLSVERRCPKNKLMFVKEINRELGGAYDTVVLENLDFDECKAKCLDGENIFCRSFEYDEQTKTCVISDEDAISRPNEMRASTSDKNQYYQLICIDGDNVKGDYIFEESDTQQLNQRRYRDVRTAFQLFRNSRLQLGSGFRGSRGRERSRLTLAECLDECLEERSFTCRSVTYSDRYQTCQLSEYDQLNGQLVYDGEFDYYENLMENLVVNKAASGNDVTRLTATNQSFGERFPESGPGSAGQTGINRPNVGGFSTIGESGTRVSSSSSFPGSSFGGTGGRVGGSSGGANNGFNSNRFNGNWYNGNDERGSGDSNRGGGPFNGDSFTDRDRFQPSRPFSDDRDQPGLYRPISTDFNNRLNGGRQTFPGFGTSTRRQTNGFGAAAQQTDSATSSFGAANSNIDSGEGAKSDVGISGGSIGFGGGSIGSSFGGPSFGSSAFGGSSSGYRPSSGYPYSSNGGLASSRCYDSDNFTPVGTRLRLRSPYIKDYVSVSSLSDCKRECLNQRSYTCRSFNYRYGSTRDNCELSDEDTHTILRLSNPSHFETDGSNDYFEHGDNSRTDCQEEDGMEFTLRTEEPFRGRIYTYGYYDRCFSRGSGSSVNILKISGPRGFPDCGTTKYGETTTNIVVVQFSDNVQTSLDKRYNLTCTVVGPGEAVVTSGYIGAGSGAPTPIEYLPAENQLQSKVRLQILYGGRPTTTIAVGDPLTFRLESQRGFNLVHDIFATNVMAKDPYSGRSVDLIDTRGCPLDTYVFPSLGKGREGNALEARFNAFKIPESNFLIFEATVRTCRGGCIPTHIH
ncbi:hypothetical protein SK128_018992 [Halocaridina rubra]|uniref:Uncharacterized protein n=1 Tax=Halocaridina rubra TaxID=373956 RepID=A0AAN8WAF1_HALRR